VLTRLEEFGEYAEIAGFKNVKMGHVEELLKQVFDNKPSNVEAQLFNAELVCTWQHLYFAALDAFTAFRNNANISKSVAMETVLYASAQRQIRKATGLIGVKPASSSLALLIIGKESDAVESALLTMSGRIHGQRDDGVLELSKRKMEKIVRAYGVSKSELATVSDGKTREEALTDLIIERMALLATER